jgi:gamma-F420-2:alpha-L-glutamate ligase
MPFPDTTSCEPDHFARFVSYSDRVVIVTRGGEAVYETVRLSKALTDLGLRVQICHPDRFAITVGANPVLTYDGEIFQLPRIVLSRTGAGTGSHTATILRQMEAMGCVVVNSLSAIQAAMDKIYTMQKAAAAGLPIPRTMIHTAKRRLITEWTGGYPCVFKLATGSHGDGVFLCKTASQLKALVGMIRALDPKRPFMVQEYLGDRPGCDLRVLVIGGKTVGAMVRSSRDGDFRANISAGGMGANFDLIPEVTEISETIAFLLGLEIAGIDLLFSADKFVLCEANSSPGFRGFERYCNLDVAGKIAQYIVDRLYSPPMRWAG